MTVTLNGNRMEMSIIQEINQRLFFQAGKVKKTAPMRPWQYIEMEYGRMGMTPPEYIPRLDSLEDAEIWMCLDERMNRRLRMREESLAG